MSLSKILSGNMNDGSSFFLIESQFLADKYGNGDSNLRGGFNR